MITVTVSTNSQVNILLSVVDIYVVKNLLPITFVTCINQNDILMLYTFMVNESMNKESISCFHIKHVNFKFGYYILFCLLWRLR